jgi:hypothetical protein
LQAIADSTKISVSLLAALERNDMARWPKGLFRRAFFREYVAAIGLSPEPMMAEFVRLFPDEPCPEVSDANELRLTLESDPRASRRATQRRVVIALSEVSGVLLVGWIAAWVLNAHLWTMSGVIGLVYYPLANMCLERTPRLRSLYGVIGPQAVYWLRASVGALRQLHIIWRRPTLSMRRLPQGAHDETPPYAGVPNGGKLMTVSASAHDVDDAQMRSVARSPFVKGNDGVGSGGSSRQTKYHVH